MCSAILSLCHLQIGTALNFPHAPVQPLNALLSRSSDIPSKGHLYDQIPKHDLARTDMPLRVKNERGYSGKGKVELLDGTNPTHVIIHYLMLHIHSHTTKLCRFNVM